MKKFLLLLVGLMLASSASFAQTAKEPKVMGNYFFTAISPNGRYMAGADPYTCSVSIYDSQTGDIVTVGDENLMEEWGLGIGQNSISNNGIAVICTSFEGTAAYVENGEVIFLPIPEGITSAFCNSITPDGSRIAGTIGVAMDPNYQGIMQRPVVWNRQADGTYSDPVELPYPTVDGTGRTPQYVLINGISADGKVLGCQLQDFSGMLTTNMVIVEDNQGEWSYKMVGNELVFPAGLEFPADPGEYPAKVDYMSAESKAAYQAALDYAATLPEVNVTDFMSEENRAAYIEANSTGWAWYEDYMTEEEIAAYNAALAKKNPDIDNYMTEEEVAAYQAAMAEWSEAYEMFDEVLTSVLMNSVGFEYNGVAISPDGSKFVVPGMKMDSDTWESVAGAYVFDVATDTYKLIGTEEMDSQLIPTTVTNDGKMVVVKTGSMWAETFEESLPVSFVYDGEQLVNLKEYLRQNDAATFEFANENMKSSILMWDEDEEDDVEIPFSYTGTASANADMDMFVSWIDNTWDYTADEYVWSYILPINETTGVSAVGTDSKGLEVLMDADGVITINGAALEVRVFDVNGRLVFEQQNPASVVNTGLGAGVYVVKAKAANESKVVKAVI